MIYSKKSYNSMNKLSMSNLPTSIKPKFDSHPSSHQQIVTQRIKSSSKYSQKLNQTKKYINNIIDEVKNKKNRNYEAIKIITTINTDVSNMLNANNLNNHHPNQHHSKLPGSISQLTLHNPENYRNENSLIRKNFKQPRSNHRNLEQQNMQLKMALLQNMEIKKQLLKQLNFLQKQNYDLKNQLDMQACRSKQLQTTQHKSINQNEDQYQESPYSLTGKFGDTQNGSKSISFQSTANNSLGSYKELMAGLRELKKENEELRINAIELLKMSE